MPSMNSVGANVGKGSDKTTVPKRTNEARGIRSKLARAASPRVWKTGTKEHMSGGISFAKTQGE